MPLSEGWCEFDVPLEGAAATVSVGFGPNKQSRPGPLPVEADEVRSRESLTLLLLVVASLLGNDIGSLLESGTSPAH